MIASTHTHFFHCYAYRFFVYWDPALHPTATKLHDVQRTASASIRKVIARPGEDLTLSPRNFLPGLVNSPSSLFLIIEEAFACQVHSDMKVLQSSILLCIGKVGLQRQLVLMRPIFYAQGGEPSA
ncbi:hypothetical protein GJ744_001459 [Endocarpon pusillum]|uniref:Uncharacterized protein n=1 Tax=Endocarpon pusillum TaxID=364733 RepID=A0A8H7AS38_9EURO|nr:hypothetical protein GJ744_001459 [Endocarpon pusillum]